MGTFGLGPQRKCETCKNFFDRPKGQPGGMGVDAERLFQCPTCRGNPAVIERHPNQNMRRQSNASANGRLIPGLGGKW